MATPKTKRILDPQEVRREVLANFKANFDTSQKTRRSFGSIPPELHKAVMSRADENDMTVGQLIATALDFVIQYEELHAEQLTGQRAPSRKLLGTV